MLCLNVEPSLSYGLRPPLSWAGVSVFEFHGPFQGAETFVRRGALPVSVHCMLAIVGDAE